MTAVGALRQVGGMLAASGMRIGLLGGSFNPAHGGHCHLSLVALARLKLDAVWWLVSPQNPLKPVAGMAPLAARLAEARRVARHPRIRVGDVETDLGTRFTVDTLAALRRRLPGVRFVWLMGADNLGQFHRWANWRTLARTTPVAVFDRPTYALRALSGPAATALVRWRVPARDVGVLADRCPPAWTFVRMPLRADSATLLRASGRWPAADAVATPTDPPWEE